MRTDLYITFFILLMILSGSFASGQDKSVCEELVDRLKSEAKSSEAKVADLTKQMEKINRKYRGDSIELKKTKENLKKEQENPKKEQTALQKKQIEQLKKDTIALTKNIRAVTAERDRLKNVDTERIRIKASYDSITAELNKIRTQWAKDTVETVRLKSVEIEKDSLQTSNDNLNAELL
ncbi:MAG: hypothetical protein LBH60_02530, partial [Prevotellaceae bacterium]|nr:hypothetical protein [Prevotellaceae bacterium]